MNRLLFSASLSLNLSSNESYSFYWTAFRNENAKQRRQTVAAERAFLRGEAVLLRPSIVGGEPAGQPGRSFQPGPRGFTVHIPAQKGTGREHTVLR